MIGITPQYALRTAVFYDPNNNPLNIPCEGPKVVPVTVNFSLDTEFQIDLSQLFQSGQLSAMQYCIVDLTAFTAANTGLSLQQSGSNQLVQVTNAAGGIVGAGGTVGLPLSVSSPAKFQLISTSGSTANIFFYNYMLPAFYLTSIGGV